MGAMAIGMLYHLVGENTVPLLIPKTCCTMSVDFYATSVRISYEALGMSVF